jgi:hypothetical protein
VKRDALYLTDQIEAYAGELASPAKVARAG